VEEITFEIKIGPKTLCFSSKTGGLLIVNNKEYLAEADGVLIYNKTKGVKADQVICQLSTNTSTLIPALKILGIPYNPYFDIKKVIESQNEITFYREPSGLAAFYNRFSTDQVAPEKRVPIIRKAVQFLIKSAKEGENFLPVEILEKLKEQCKLLGFYNRFVKTPLSQSGDVGKARFQASPQNTNKAVESLNEKTPHFQCGEAYQGFPIFDAAKGVPKLLSRLGIHVGSEEIMVSTSSNRYAREVEEIARLIEKNTKTKGIRKKNRVRFERTRKILKELGIKP